MAIHANKFMMYLHVFSQTGPPQLLGHATSLPHKHGGVSLNDFPKDPTSELADFIIHTVTFMLSAKQRNCQLHYVKFLSQELNTGLRNAKRTR